MPYALLLPALALTIRVMLALLFTSALASKIRAFPRFVAAIADYRLLPAGLAPPAALLLVALEFAAVFTSLLVGGPPAGGLAGGLLLLFAGAIAINLLRGRDAIDCGCSLAGGAQRLHWGLVARNLTLALTALTAGMVGGPLPSMLVVEAIAAGGVLFGLYRAIDIMESVEPAWSDRRLERTGS
jgi:hypothetical protein